MSEDEILAFQSLWTNSSCCKKTLGSVLKGKDTFGDFFPLLLFQEHSSVIHLEADLSMEIHSGNLAAGFKTNRL